MRKRGILLLAFLTAVFLSALAFAGDNPAIERGEKLFNDPTFAGGEKACSSCHENGIMLEDVGEKKTFNVINARHEWSLRSAINACIVIANKGNFINNESTEMKDLISYVKSLGSEAMKRENELRAKAIKSKSKK